MHACMPYHASYMLSTMHAASCHWQYMPLGCSCLLWLRMQLQKLTVHQSTGTPLFAKQAKVCNHPCSCMHELVLL